MKILALFLTILVLLVSCGDVGKVLRNEKENTTDEFLVKKKGPLVLPPNFEEIPSPDTIKKKSDDQQNKIKKILKSQKKKDNKGPNKSSSVEKSIIEKIRK